MSVIKANGAGSAASDFYSYKINQSLRFNDNDSPALSKAYAAAQTNTKKLTISVWVKRGNLGIRTTIIYAKNVSAGKLSFQTTDKIYFNAFDTGYNGFESDALFRDVSAWYHIVAQADSAGQTGANINRVWVNGVELSNNKTSAFVPNNTDTMLLRNGVTTYIGDDTDGAYHFDGYLAEMNVVDGSIVAPTEFGETKDGVWIPKSYSGSYGTNGFYLPFDDSSAIGDDESSNTNDWTVVNLAATDVVKDSPTNNFCTMNSVEASSGVSATLSEGNLKTVGTTVSYSGGIASTFEQSSGKWYWEVYVNSEVTAGSNFYSFVGAATGDNNLIHKSNNSQIPTVAAGVNGWSWEGDGTINLIGTGTKAVSSVTAPSAGSVLGFAIDLDNGNVYFYHNGTAQNSGNAVITGVTGLVHNPMVGVYNGSTVTFNFGQDSTFAGATTAGGNADGNGIGDFKYAPPSGFLALCTKNLPDPTIGPTADTLATDNFNTVLYTGNGVQDTTISGVGFQPDWVWIKDRTGANHNILFDSVRGGTKQLFSSLTNSEQTNTDLTNGFASDGFIVGDNVTGTGATNLNNNTYVSWNWKAGTAFSNSAGTNGATIASSGSVNTDAGFSIVSWTGNATNSTVYHALDEAPQLIIAKNRSTSGTEWPVLETLVNGATHYLRLNETYTSTTTSIIWNNTNPTNNVFSIGTYSYINENLKNIITYCFHSVEGYSKVGSYTANGLADGPFVFTGFRPAWIMVKGSSLTSEWYVWDSVRNTYNVANKTLNPNKPATEYSAGALLLDLNSNGFKVRDAVGSWNLNGNTYIYLAFAENPFKYSNAR